jgi:hypothetical protein
VLGRHRSVSSTKTSSRFFLMCGNARKAIIAESAKRGMTPFLPPLVPFGSKQWPTLITPRPGQATIDDLLP